MRPPCGEERGEAEGMTGGSFDPSRGRAYTEEDRRRSGSVEVRPVADMEEQVPIRPRAEHGTVRQGHLT